MHVLEYVYIIPVEKFQKVRRHWVSPSFFLPTYFISSRPRFLRDLGGQKFFFADARVM